MPCDKLQSVRWLHIMEINTKYIVLPRRAVIRIPTLWLNEAELALKAVVP